MRSALPASWTPSICFQDKKHCSINELTDKRVLMVLIVVSQYSPSRGENTVQIR